MRTTPRERREVSPRAARLLSPVFRYSIGRDAYVLRGIGNKRGPVLTIRREGVSRSASASSD